MADRQAFKGLRAAVRAALIAADPLGLLHSGAPEDEYDPEVGTILPRLNEAGSAEHVKLIIHEEFVRWFGAHSAGPAGRYAEAADAIWSAVEVYRGP